MFISLKTIFKIITLSFFASFVGQESQAEEMFVRWRHGNHQVIGQHYSRVGGRLVWRSSLVPGLSRIDVPRAQANAALMYFKNLSREVVYAEPNYKVRRILPAMRPMFFPSGLRYQNPNDPMLSRQWALTTDKGINLWDAWKKTRGSKQIRVAVIDTGVDSKHVELSDRVLAGYDFIDKTDKVIDHHGHGTHVSGVIGARVNNSEGIVGINPDVSIIPIRAVPNNDDETDADVIASFEFAVKAGARVANCSFGKAESSQAVGDTIAAAGERGLIVAVAAGNSGADINKRPSFPASFGTPNMIVVAASTKSGSLASFSNFGMGKVDLAAPGASILSTVTDGGYSAWDGTSMATPHVAGIAALVLSVNPQLTPAALKKVILDTVTQDVAYKGKITSSGRINASAAVNAAVFRRNSLR